MDRFDIVAKVPPGATKDQVKEMMVNLLKGRGFILNTVWRKISMRTIW